MKVSSHALQGNDSDNEEEGQSCVAEMYEGDGNTDLSVVCSQNLMYNHNSNQPSTTATCTLQGNDHDNEEEGRSQAAEVFEDDGNTDLCVLCGLGGSLLCCDGCPAAYHMRCIGETAKSIPEGEWLCPECSVGGRGELPMCHISHASELPTCHMSVSYPHATCQ